MELVRYEGTVCEEERSLATGHGSVYYMYMYDVNKNVLYYTIVQHYPNYSTSQQNHRFYASLSLVLECVPFVQPLYYSLAKTDSWHWKQFRSFVLASTLKAMYIPPL